jgi:beta-glucanase (GH16 family)
MVRNVLWGLLLGSVLLQAGCGWDKYDGEPVPDAGVGSGGDGAGGGDGLDGGPPQLAWLNGPGAFQDRFDTLDTTRWVRSDGWFSSEDFNAGWRADHVQVSGGNLLLKLDTTPCPSGCSGRPYAAGEMVTNRYNGYGRYEVRLKPARGSGTLTSFSIYTGPADNTRWDSMDVAFLGRDTRRVQTNYVVAGTGHYNSVVLPFDAANAFHTYTIEWTREGVHWYVDGKRIFSATEGPLPAIPGRMLLNFWPGIGPTTESWMGTFSYPGSPLVTTVDEVRYGLAAPKTVAVDFETKDTWKVAIEAPPEGGTASQLDAFQSDLGHQGKMLVLSYSIRSGSRALVGLPLAAPQDWSNARYVNFWLRGTNTQDPFRLELRSGGSFDTASRFTYDFKENHNGWKWISVPLSEFKDPDGQPVSASALLVVQGLALEPLGGVSHNVFVDDIEVER